MTGKAEAGAIGSHCDFTTPIRTPGVRRWLAYVVLMSSGPMMAMMFAALGPNLPTMAPHLAAFGDGALAAQLVMTMPAVGVITGGLVSGPLIERFTLRRVLLLALVVYALAGSAGLYLDNLPALFASRFLLGLAVSHVSNCIVLLVGAWFGEERRARLLGFQAAAAGLLSVAALLLAGSLGNRFGWRAPFALYLVSLAVLFAAFFAVPRGAATGASERGPKPKLSALKPLWPIYALQLPLCVAYFMTSVQLSFLLAADDVVSPVTRSVVIAVGVAAGGVGGGFYGFIYRRLGPHWMAPGLTALMGAGFLLIGGSRDIPLVALGCALAGGGGGMISPYFSGRLLSAAAAEIRPRALGLMFTTLYVADFLNPVVVNPLRVAAGIHAAYIAVGLLLTLGFAAMRLRGKAPIGVAGR